MIDCPEPRIIYQFQAEFFILLDAAEMPKYF